MWRWGWYIRASASHFTIHTPQHALACNACRVCYSVQRKNFDTRIAKKDCGLLCAIMCCVRKTPQTAEYFREYRKRTHERRLECERRYSSSTKARKRKREYLRNYWKLNKQEISSRRRLAELSRPEVMHARRIFKNACRAGKIKRFPCEVCGLARSEGHHDDYSKPLAVRWLCRTHHGQQHRINAHNHVRE